MNTIELQNTASFDGSTLTGRSHYSHPTPHHEDFHLVVCDPTADDCSYWGAIHGHCYPLRDIKRNTAIAVVQNLLALALAKPCDTLCGVYVIFQPKTHSLRAWEKWEAKWKSKTTPNQ